MQAENSDQGLELLIGQLRHARQLIDEFAGLGEEVHAVKPLRNLERNTIVSGQLANFIGDIPLNWHLSRSELADALKDRVEAVGVSIRSPIRKAREITAQAISQATEKEIELLLGQNAPSGSSVIITNPGIPQGFLNRGPRVVRYVVIKEEFAAVRQAMKEVIEALNKLSLRCLQTGRAVAFRPTPYGSEMVLPARWGKSGRIAKGDRFLLSCEIPSLVAEQRSGPIPNDAADRIKMAVTCLERLYAHPDLANRKIKKDDTRAVFQEYFKISENSFDKSVWPAANIPKWKARGRVKETAEVKRFEIKSLLSSLR